MLKHQNDVEVVKPLGLQQQSFIQNNSSGLTLLFCVVTVKLKTRSLMIQ